jgi:hypothetical protein
VRAHTPLRGALRAFAPALALAVAGLTVACADGPGAPTAPVAAAPRHELLSPDAPVDVLTRDVALDSAVTVTGKITNGGGSISIPEAGMTITFPAGLVKKPTQFWATARAGKVVAYDFGPSGTFTQALTVTQKLQGTSLWKVKDPSAIQGAFYKDDRAINDAAEHAFVSELRPTEVDLQGNKVSFTVDHFSGYLMSTGRTR